MAQFEGEDREGGVDSADLARQVAREVVQSDQMGEVEFREAEEGYDSAYDTAPEEVEGGYEEEESVEAPEPAPSSPEMDQAYAALMAAGIDLGVSRNDLPEAIRPAYDKLVEQAIVAARDYSSRYEALEEAFSELQQFSQSLQANPDKVLTAMAVHNPEAFRKAVETFEEMQNDPKVMALVQRELQAEAKLSAAKRAEEAYARQQLQQQTAVFTDATHRAAVKYGVDKSVAEQMVAYAITAGQGRFQVNEVDSVVARLRPQATQLATQQKVAAAKRAPQPMPRSRPPGARTEPGEAQPSPGLQHARRGMLRDVVKDAFRRHSKTGTE